jgi:signal transduction histidine kinase
MKPHRPKSRSKKPLTVHAGVNGPHERLGAIVPTGLPPADTVNPSLHPRRLANENSRMAERLVRTEAHMDHFLRALSHDMGANFLVMENSLRQLKHSCAEAPLPAVVEAANHVEACLRESQRFLADLAQLSTTGSVSMSPVRVELDRVVDEVLFEQKDLVAERGATVDVGYPLPAVWCNVTRAKQVFTNLVRNALRHGCDLNHPRLAIDVVPAPADEDRPGRVWLRVEDNGPGIPERHRQEIFLPGKRLPRAADGGSGMGLAIVQRIVDYYGGTIFVDPAFRRGARFIFSLPAALPSNRTSIRDVEIDHQR